jgi:FkbM family methyltransferase
MLNLTNLSKVIYLLRKPQLIPAALDGLVVDTYQQLDKSWLHELEIDTVVDIGANVGRTVLTFRKLFPNARIHAFEPLPICYEELCKRTSKLTNCYTYNVGLGREKNEFKMNESSHNPSSSLLKMSELHSQAFPFTADSKEVLVNVVPLDSLSLELGKSIFIKLDVQGYEDAVIEGGLTLFTKAKIVILEVSYEALYDNQVLFDGIYALMKKIGFRFAGTLSSLKDPRTGKIIEADAIFVKD